MKSSLSDAIRGFELIASSPFPESTDRRHVALDKLRNRGIVRFKGVVYRLVETAGKEYNSYTLKIGGKEVHTWKAKSSEELLHSGGAVDAFLE